MQHLLFEPDFCLLSLQMRTSPRRKLLLLASLLLVLLLAERHCR